MPWTIGRVRGASRERQAHGEGVSHEARGSDKTSVRSEAEGRKGAVGEGA